MDLSRYDNKQLKNLLENYRRQNLRDGELAIIREMSRRGIATKKHYATLRWNQESVRDALKPFKEVAATVQQNERTSYTQAGGRKIGRKKDDPDHRWVDSYSAIKRGSINTIFVCYIKKPGDEPTFLLKDYSKSVEKSFNADDLELALSEWRRTAEAANNI